MINKIYAVNDFGGYKSLEQELKDYEVEQFDQNEINSCIYHIGNSTIKMSHSVSDTSTLQIKIASATENQLFMDNLTLMEYIKNADPKCNFKNVIYL